MRTRYSTLIVLAVLLATGGYTVLVYGALPPLLPVHMNFAGAVDRWAAKPWAAALMPSLMLILTALKLALPALLPEQFAANAFRHVFNYILTITITLFGLFQVVILQAALHPRLNLAGLLMTAIFIFQLLMGRVLGGVPRNRWIGIRSPWTLADETVWRSTHELAARLSIVIGLAGIIAIRLGAPAGTCLLVLVIVNLLPVLYSFILYRQKQRTRHNSNPPPRAN